MLGHVCTLIKVLCLIEQENVRSAWKLHLPQPFSIFPPSDLNISSIAVPALKLGVHVLKTLWKVWPYGKCKAPTPVGHV